jgi:hypothetical protein
MASVCFSPISAEVARFTRLTDCGTPVTGAGAAAVVDGFVDVTVDADRQPGGTFNLRDGTGLVAISGVDPAQTTTSDVTITVCTLDPEALALLDAAAVAITTTGAPNVTGCPIPVTGAPAVGAAFSTRGPLGPVAVELWQPLAGENACAGEPCWSRWLLARVVNLRRTAFEFEDDAFTIRLRGTLLHNPGWGRGVGDYPRAVRSDEPVTFERICAEPPPAGCGLVAVTGCPGHDPYGTVQVPGTFATQIANLQAKVRAGQLVQALDLGDSIMQGAFSSNWRTKSFMALVNDTLAGTLGDGGAGMQGVQNEWQAASYLSSTGGWLFAGGGASAMVAANLTAGATMTWANQRGRFIRVHYQSATNTGVMTVAIDGGAAVAVNTQGTPRDRVVQFDAGSTGAHSVVVTAPTATPILLAGVEGKNASGWLHHNDAVAGTRSDMPQLASHASGGSTYKDQIVDAALRMMGRIDVLYYTFGSNDAVVAFTPATFEHNVLTTLTRARSSNPDMAIVVIVEHSGSIPQDFPVFAAFREILERQARAHGAAFVDLWSEGDRSLAWMQARGYMNPDNVHWTDAGHAWGAAIILRAFQAVG